MPCPNQQAVKCYAASIVNDNPDTTDYYELIAELVDSCEEVIYTWRSHNFVRELSGSEECAALEWLEEMDIQPVSYDEWAQQITYAALIIQIQEELDA